MITEWISANQKPPIVVDEYGIVLSADVLCKCIDSMAYNGYIVASWDYNENVWRMRDHDDYFHVVSPDIRIIAWTALPGD